MLPGGGLLFEVGSVRGAVRARPVRLHAGTRGADLVGGHEDTVMFHGQSRPAQREADPLFQACMTDRRYKRAE